MYSPVVAAFSCLALGAVAVGSVACGGAQTPHERALVVRAEAPRCAAGNTTACRSACAAEGPNQTCERACQSGDAEGCFRLASRLERGVDVADPEASSTPVAEGDPVIVTSLYQKACEAGLAPGCRMAGERLLNGQGVGDRKDGGARAVRFLKRGCETLGDGLSCCGMAALNQSLAASGAGPEGPRADDGFAIEARRWSSLASRHDVTCPGSTR
jgi:hypothetical protein